MGGGTYTPPLYRRVPCLASRACLSGLPLGPPEVGACPSGMISIVAPHRCSPGPSSRSRYRSSGDTGAARRGVVASLRPEEQLKAVCFNCRSSDGNRHQDFGGHGDLPLRPQNCQQHRDAAGLVEAHQKANPVGERAGQKPDILPRTSFSRKSTPPVPLVMAINCSTRP